MKTLNPKAGESKKEGVVNFVLAAFGCGFGWKPTRLLAFNILRSQSRLKSPTKYTPSVITS
jgi:hypothetical protein